jgi:hypothetical protein
MLLLNCWIMMMLKLFLLFLKELIIVLIKVKNFKWKPILFTKFLNNKMLLKKLKNFKNMKLKKSIKKHLKS